MYSAPSRRQWSLLRHDRTVGRERGFGRKSGIVWRQICVTHGNAISAVPIECWCLKRAPIRPDTPRNKYSRASHKDCDGGAEAHWILIDGPERPVVEAAWVFVVSARVSYGPLIAVN